MDIQVFLDTPSLRVCGRERPLEQLMDSGTETMPASARHTEHAKTSLAELGLGGALSVEGRRTAHFKEPTHAECRQLVHLLKERLSQTDIEMQALQDKQAQFARRDRIQSKLILHLRGQLNLQTEKIEEYVQAFGELESSGQLPQQGHRRVVSLDGALQKINGVEVPVEPAAHARLKAGIKDDEFDPEEFQPIAELDESSVVIKFLTEVKKSIAQRWQAAISVAGFVAHSVNRKSNTEPDALFFEVVKKSVK